MPEQQEPVSAAAHGARAAQGEIHCEHPDASLYTFVGNLLLRPPLAPGAAAALPLSPASVLLRGSALQNTRWALGAVVFAGHETKARMAGWRMC